MRWLALLPLLMSFLAAARAENWPEFRGPTGDGMSTSRKLPTTWSESENILWKSPVHDKGWSSPVIWEDQVWVTTAPRDGKAMYAVCFDKKSGTVLHDIRIFDIPKPAFCHEFNSYASSTPAIEAGRIYCHFGTHGTACLDTKSGHILWTREDLHCDHFRGAASSPILFDNLLMLTFDGFDVQFLTALDKRTGKSVWQMERNIDYGIHNNNGDQKKGYVTPSVFKIGDAFQLISPSAGATISYDPYTGKELWRVNSGGMNAAARPLYSHGFVIANSSTGGFGQFAVRPDGKGNVSATHVAWKYNRSMPTRPSPIVDGDHLYLIDDKGIASCLHAKSGEPQWSKRVGGSVSASLVSAAGKIFCFEQDGESLVFEANPKEFKLVATNHLEQGCMASPAISDDSLFVRTKTHLYRIGKKE